MVHLYKGTRENEIQPDVEPELDVRIDILKMLQKIETLKPTLTPLQVTVIETRLLAADKATAKSISKLCKCSVPQVYLAEKKVMELIRAAVLTHAPVLPVADHLDAVAGQE